MNYNKLAKIKNITVNTLGREFEFLTSKDRPAVICIHGFTGLSSGFLYLAKNIYEKLNYNVYVIRLPGHGTNLDNLRAVSSNDIISKCVETYLDIQYRHGSVYVIGLSMGGLLTSILASIFDIEKIVLFAPAFFPSHPLFKLIPIIGMLGISEKNDKEKNEDYEAFRNFDDIKFLEQTIGISSEDIFKNLDKIYDEYYSYSYSDITAKILYKIINIAKSRINLIKSDTLVVVSEKDRSVKVETGNYIINNIASTKKELVKLENSNHIVIMDKDKEIVLEKTLDWLR